MPTPSTEPRLSPLEKLNASLTQRSAQQTIRRGQLPQLELNVTATNDTGLSHWNTVFKPAKALRDSTKAEVDARKRLITDSLETLKNLITDPAKKAEIDQIKVAITATTTLADVQRMIVDLTAIPAVTTAAGVTPAQPSWFHAHFRASVPTMSDANFALGEADLISNATQLQTSLTAHLDALRDFNTARTQHHTHRQTWEAAKRARDALQSEIQAEEAILRELSADIPAIQQKVTTALENITIQNAAAGASFDATHAKPIIESCFIAAHYLTKKSHGDAHGEKAAVSNHAYTKDGLSYDVVTTVSDASGTAATTGAPTPMVISAPGAATGGAAGATTTRDYKTKLELINAFNEGNKDTRARLTGHKQDDAVMHSFRVVAEKFNHRIEVDSNWEEAMRFKAIAEHMKKQDPTNMGKLKVSVVWYRTPIQLIYNLCNRQQYNGMVEALAAGKSTLERGTTLRAAAPAATAPTV